jgi:uncharacterized protein (TIRG00374 family)
MPRRHSPAGSYDPRVRRWYVWLPISLGILALLVWRTRPWEAVDLASGLDLPLLLAAVGLNIVVIALWAVRSRSLMAAVGNPLGSLELVPIVSFANTINNLTPASSGEILRAIILKQRHDVGYQSSAAVILAERLWAIGLMLVTAVAAALGTVILADTPAVVAAWAVVGVLAFSPSLAYRAGIRPGRTAMRLARLARSERVQRFARHLAEVDDRLAAIVLDPKRSVHFIITTGAIFAVFAAQLWLVLRAFDVSLPLGGAWAAIGLATCAGVISALPFGLGAADAVLVVLLVAQGVAAPTAAAAAVVLRSVATLPLGIAGTISWIRLRHTPTMSDPATEPQRRRS